MKRLYTLIILIVLASGARAQITFDAFLEAGDDANQLIEDYMEPMFTGFGYGVNSGWYNTAKPHKLLGFDITATANFALVPTGNTEFQFNPADYTNITTASGSTETLQTIMGDHLDPDEMPELVFNAGDRDNEIRISAPQGIGMEEAVPFNAVPAPMAQVGIGLIKGTELKIRFIPAYTLEDDGGAEHSVSMFGFGIMHDVKQWIPGMSALPFDLSAFFGRSSLSTELGLSDDGTQTAEFDVTGTTIQGIVSKKLLFLTAYGGLGVATSKTDFKMKGTYDIQSGSITDPVDLSYKTSGMRANVGLRVKLLIVTAHVEYAIQEYNTLTVGAGISLR